MSTTSATAPHLASAAAPDTAVAAACVAPAAGATPPVPGPRGFAWFAATPPAATPAPAPAPPAPAPRQLGLAAGFGHYLGSAVAGGVHSGSGRTLATDDKTEAGKDQGFCLRVAAGQAWYCQFTNILKDGQLMVSGPFNDKGDSVMAVTGGSGKYLGARGTMTLHARDAKGTAFDFTFKLL